MIKLRNLFVSNFGGYIHVGLWVVMVMISYHHPIALFFLILDAIFLYKHYRFIFFLGLLLSVVITVHYFVDDNHTPTLFSFDDDADVIDVHQNHYTVRQNGDRYYLYTKNDDSLKPGDTIQISGYHLYQDGYVIDHVFDYSQYLKANRIEGSVYATDVERLSESFHVNRFKYEVRKTLAASFDDKTSAYIALILLGDDSYLSESTQNAVQSLNINHLFAVSGMHVAVLCALFNRFLSFFHLRKRIQNSVLIFFLFGYAYLCGFTPSIVRAASMVGLWFLNEEIKTPLSKLDILTFVMVLFLLINPYSFHLLSFQLSFLMSYVIVLGQPIIQDDTSAISLSKLTIVAFVFGFPFFLETNGGFHLLAIPVGILFSWFVTHFLMPAILIVMIIPSFQTIFHWAINAFEWLLSMIADERMQIAFNFSNDIAKFLYWLGLFFFFFRKKSIKSRISGTIVILFAFIISLSWIQITHYTSVSILDVGNGDSIHIQSGQTHCLIDTGSNDDMDRIITYLKRRNIDYLDTIFVTHRHDDHVGELGDLFNEFTVFRYVGHPNDYIPFSTDQIIPKLNDVFVCGDMSFQVVFFDTTNENENNNSLVLLGTIYDHKWLFTGDIESEVEHQLVSALSESISYLKVPHHGSITSSTMRFISKLNPKIAIISVGKHNSYNHPSEEVISRYQSLGTITYRTDEVGTLTFHFYRPFSSPLVTSEAQKRKPYGYLKQGFNFWVWMFGK